MSKKQFVLLIVILSMGIIIGSSKCALSLTDEIIDNQINYNKISLGSYSLIVLKDNGTVYGLTTSTEDHTTPTMQLIEGLDNIVELAAGKGVHIALDADGFIWRFVPLDDGSFSEPVKINGIDNVVSIRMDVDQAFVLKSDGTVWMFGFIDSYGLLWTLFESEYNRLTAMNIEFIDISDEMSIDDEELMLNYWGNHYVLDEDYMIGITPWQLSGLENIIKITNSIEFIDDNDNFYVFSNNGFKKVMGVENINDIVGDYVLKKDQTVWQIIRENSSYKLVEKMQELSGIVSLKGSVTPNAIDNRGNVWSIGRHFFMADPNKSSQDTLVFEFKFAENETWENNYQLNTTQIIYEDSLYMDAHLWRVVVIKNDGSLWYTGKSFVELTEEDIQNVDVPLSDYGYEGYSDENDYIKIQVQPKQIYNDDGTPFNFFD